MAILFGHGGELRLYMATSHDRRDDVTFISLLYVIHTCTCKKKAHVPLVHILLNQLSLGHTVTITAITCGNGCCFTCYNYYENYDESERKYTLRSVSY